MTSSRILFVLCNLLLFLSCAPLMVARTPKPVPVGETRVTDALGWSFLNVGPIPSDPCVDPNTGCFPRNFERIDSSGAPFPMTPAFSITWSSGVDAVTDQHFSLEALSGPPGFRYGQKMLILDGPVLVAVDYGASVYWINYGIDAGLIASVPLEGWEPYLAVRGFGNLRLFPGRFYEEPVDFLFDASATLGSRIAVGEHDLFLELTIATMRWRYDFQKPDAFGFSLTPAIAWRW
jgi:hypothetical protein